MRAKARALSRVDEGRTWTAVDVEKAMFVKMRLWSGLEEWDMGEIGDVAEMVCAVETEEEEEEVRKEGGNGRRFLRGARRSVRVSATVEETADGDFDDGDEDWFEAEYGIGNGTGRRI